MDQVAPAHTPEKLFSQVATEWENGRLDGVHQLCIDGLGAVINRLDQYDVGPLVDYPFALVNAQAYALASTVPIGRRTLQVHRALETGMPIDPTEEYKMCAADRLAMHRLRAEMYLLRGNASTAAVYFDRTADRDPDQVQKLQWRSGWEFYDALQEAEKTQDPVLIARVCAATIRALQWYGETKLSWQLEDRLRQINAPRGRAYRDERIAIAEAKSQAKLFVMGTLYVERSFARDPFLLAGNTIIPIPAKQ